MCVHVLYDECLKQKNKTKINICDKVRMAKCLNKFDKMIWNDRQSCR